MSKVFHEQEPAHSLYLNSSVSQPSQTVTVPAVILSLKGGCLPQGDAADSECDNGTSEIQVSESKGGLDGGGRLRPDSRNLEAD